MAYIPWRSRQLAGGCTSPFEHATSRQVRLKREIAHLLGQPGTEQHLLSKLLLQAQRVKIVLGAEAVRDPVVTDPRKKAKPNTGRTSKPELPAAPRGGRMAARLRIIG